MKIAIIFITLKFLCISIPAQVSEEWIQRYNGSGNSNDNAYSLAIDASGNVYVTGYSTAIGGNIDYSTIKYNSTGVVQWIQRYNGPGNSYDFAYSIAVDVSGNVYVTGSSFGSGVGFDFATIKYSSTGSVQWIQRYNGPSNGSDEAASIAVDAAGNVYVTGSSTGSGTGFDFAVVKYNSAGVQQWAARYNNVSANGDDYTRSLAIDASGNVYVTGFSLSNFAGYDYFTIKYNSTGVLQWSRRYNGTGNDEDFSNAIAVDAGGNVYVTGRSTGSGTGTDFATIKYNSAGVQQWAERYNNVSANSSDEAGDIAVDASGNVYVTGFSSGNFGGDDFFTIKYDPGGSTIWTQRYNGPSSGFDKSFSVSIDGSGDVYVAGVSAGIGTLDDYAVLKYNTIGTQQWVQRYNGPGNAQDEAHSIEVDVAGNVYVTGGSAEAGGLDYATIKYSQSIGINPVSSEIPSDYFLGQNYPNPFNPSTKFRIDVPVSSVVKIVVYDVLGKEAAVILDNELTAGTYEVDFEGSRLSSGVYYYKLSAGDPSKGSGKVFTSIKKMILVK